jgi:hypothetical protein
LWISCAKAGDSLARSSDARSLRLKQRDFDSHDWILHAARWLFRVLAGVAPPVVLSGGEVKKLIVAVVTASTLAICIWGLTDVDANPTSPGWRRIELTGFGGAFAVEIDVAPGWEARVLPGDASMFFFGPTHADLGRSVLQIGRIGQARDEGIAEFDISHGTWASASQRWADSSGMLLRSVYPPHREQLASGEDVVVMGRSYLEAGTPRTERWYATVCAEHALMIHLLSVVPEDLVTLTSSALSLRCQR